MPTTEVLSEKIKWLVIKSIYSNDDLMEFLVLKGGNAIALVHQINIRTSVDVDFSLSGDYPGGRERLENDLIGTITEEFGENGYLAFDFHFLEKPRGLSSDIADFWGGYSLDFKIIPRDKHDQLRSSWSSAQEQLEVLRRNAISINGSTKIEIDISKAEITDRRIEQEVDGLIIYAYSQEMIICEKFRAICQQMPEYSEIVHRANRPGAPRARDFFDIYTLCTNANVPIDLGTSENIQLLQEIFKIKRVPLIYLDKLEEVRDFHASSFPAVQAAINIQNFTAEDAARDFDFYFDFVLDLYKENIKPNLEQM